MEKNDGGPAFPSKRVGVNNEPDIVLTQGMTLRDYMAGQALAGLCAKQVQGAFSGAAGERRLAVYCYAYADAMLKQRESPTQGGSDG